jgi:hypothetical protein
MTLLEVAVAAGLLGIIMAVSVQMLRVMGDRQRAIERRSVAIETVQALAEQLGNTPWEQLTPEAAEQLQIPDAVVRHLPGGELRAAIYEESEPVVAKRVMLELRWKGPREQPVAPAQLTTWVYPDKSSQP